MKNKIKILVIIVLFGFIAQAQKTSTVLDKRDNQTYKTVQIGEQVWMAENLNYKTDEGSWCYDNKERNCKKYGRLYNWETAKLSCPNGWHLATDEEWTILEKKLGLSDKKSSGFEVLYAGLVTIVEDYELYESKNHSTYFWTSTENDEFTVWTRVFYKKKLGITRMENPFTCKNILLCSGISVRCVKD